MKHVKISKMKSLTKCLIIAVLLLSVISCSKSQTSGTKTKDIDVRVGLKGLTMEFLKNTPPQMVFEESTFPTIIKVKNEGAYSLDENDEQNNAVFSLGVESDYTKNVELLAGGRVKKIEEVGAPNLAQFSLEGKSNINPKGGEEVISYNIQAGKLDPQSEAHASTMIATLCYPYETILSANVCVDSDIANVLPGKKVCKVQDLTFSNGQGAPVAVTKVEVLMIPTQSSQENTATGNIKPQFVLLIENKGSGTVIRRDSVNNFCTKSEAKHDDLNMVSVSVFLGKDELDCTPKDKVYKDEKYAYIKLKDKKELARCNLPKESVGIPAAQGAFSSPLVITLSYGYTQSISANYFLQKTAR